MADDHQRIEARLEIIEDRCRRAGALECAEAPRESAKIRFRVRLF